MKLRISFLLLLGLSFAGCRAQKPLSANGNGLSRFLDSAEKQLGFHGTVLLVRGADTILNAGYGYSDIKKGTNTDRNIAYNIASVSKAFTAICVLKLAEEGKLSLQDSLGRFFKNTPPDKAGITIHQLLTHQSGIGQHYAADGEDNPEKAAKKIFSLTLTDTPGKRFIYGNDNYTLLALITEKLTGHTWEAYTRNTILTPLQMNATFFFAGYNSTTQARVPMTDGSKPKKSKRDYGSIGATGMFSTTADLARLQEAIKTDRILSQKSRELLFGRYAKIKSPWEGTDTHYAYGMFVTGTVSEELQAVWFRGTEGDWGTAIVIWMPATGTSLIVLSNKEMLTNGERSQVYISNELLKRMGNLH